MTGFDYAHEDMQFEITLTFKPIEVTTLMFALVALSDLTPTEDRPDLATLARRFAVAAKEAVEAKEQSLEPEPVEEPI